VIAEQGTKPRLCQPSNHAMLSFSRPNKIQIPEKEEEQVLEKSRVSRIPHDHLSKILRICSDVPNE
jgi:hypothetical protein